MKKEIEQQIFDKMKAKDFGESMCNETKLNVLRWTIQQLRKHNVNGSLGFDKGYEQGYNDATREACAEIAKNYHPNDHNVLAGMCRASRKDNHGTNAASMAYTSLL